MSNVPTGAEHDLRAPWNQTPEIDLPWWMREFELDSEPTCDVCGADSDELHTYEKRATAQYDFYCKDCLLEMAEEDYGRPVNEDELNEWIDNAYMKLL